jgi:hypothetical protein
MVEVRNAIACRHCIEPVRDPHELVWWERKIERLEGATQ